MYIIRILLLCFLMPMGMLEVDAQNSGAKDSSSQMISLHKGSEKFNSDSLVSKESSPLDITNDRGLFLMASDGKMQMRILGSIRFSSLYDMVEVPVKNSFNTYYLPTGENNIKLPNYYNSLNESRLGFEVKRLAGQRVIFGRIEMDFNGQNGQFRIRHAYGQVGRLLFGQTWSLFSNVSSMPATVDGNGPTGSVILRNPQVRYSISINEQLAAAIALEYSLPDLSASDFDTLDMETIQMFPDLTARIRHTGDYGDIQLSAVFNVISLKNKLNEISNLQGFGGALSGVFKLTKGQKIKYQLNGGKSISHYITTFSGTGMDAAYHSATNEFEGLWALGGFVSYGWDLTKKITSSVSCGSASIFNKPYQDDAAYRNSLSLSFDAFFNIISGSRIGFEYAYGKRWNKDKTDGYASRFWVLFYYDF